MPPRKRAEMAPDDTETSARKQASAPEICRVCWPGGWPEDDTYTAACEHGDWSYPARRPKA